MPECPIADECPNFEEQIEGMGCQHYGDRGGMEWCQHYNLPINELKTAPVVPGEEVVLEVTDMHESGAGVGHDDSGYVVMVDGVLPDARVRAEITSVKSNYARADLIEKLPMDDEEEDDSDESEADDGSDESEDGGSSRRGPKRERLGSRENFWGN